jgi:alkylhydroperoxidase/carboxymuconolactone decarboxylase family protein YurZ
LKLKPATATSRGWKVKTRSGRDLTRRQRKLRERFKKERNYWSQIWETLLREDPDFFEHFLNFSSYPFIRGSLPPKVKELVLIAVNAATTHLYEPGLRIHIANALKAGATKEEILEVFELVSLIGMHSCSLGIPVLLEEMEKFSDHDSKKKTPAQANLN